MKLKSSMEEPKVKPSMPKSCEKKLKSMLKPGPAATLAGVMSGWILGFKTVCPRVSTRSRRRHNAFWAAVEADAARCGSQAPPKSMTVANDDG